jgi:protein-arginine kinase activator protein McsA
MKLILKRNINKELYEENLRLKDQIKALLENPRLSGSSSKNH